MATEIHLCVKPACGLSRLLTGREILGSGENLPPLWSIYFDAVIPRDARIERRMMFGYPAAFLNGHLFAGLHQENFILKLSPADRDQLTMECNIPAFEPIPGRAMHEYRALPESALADRRTLAAWLARSMAYVAAKPPKSKKVVTPKSRMPRRR